MIKNIFKPKFNFIYKESFNFKFFSSTSTNRCFNRLITPNEFRERQNKIVQLVNQEKSSFLNFENLIIIPSALKSFQAYTKIPNINFKQNSNFVYLTGLNNIESSGCILTILFSSDKIKETTLFHSTLNDQISTWEGDGIKSNYLINHVNQVVDNVSDIVKFDDFLKSCSNRKILLTDINYNDAHFFKNHHNLRFLSISDCIDKLRLIKSENELKAMGRTCNIGTNALNKTINWTKSNNENCLLNEKQLEANFDYESKINGAVKMAYPAVVAGNDRATIIHYGANSQNLKYKDWVLMDAGCEDYDGYNSDITRSWQISKTVENNLQFCLYQALNEVQKKLISSIIVNQTTLNSLFQDMTLLLIEVLKEFSVLNKNYNYSYHNIYPYCPHHVSHYLGLDIHDSPTVSRDEVLKAGMCFTIEPGLYFRDCISISKDFKGIGLRIEDNIIINYENKVENLTKNCLY